MRIEHVALWTRNLETMREFYVKWFAARSGAKYISQRRPFESYFLQFTDGARLELMQLPDLADRAAEPGVGWAHLAISVGSAERVDALTNEMREASVTVIGKPRQTGDGYYESVILDPDGNQIEITI